MEKDGIRHIFSEPFIPPAFEAPWGNGPRPMSDAERIIHAPTEQEVDAMRQRAERSAGLWVAHETMQLPVDTSILDL